jgi:hypothetical protein
MKTILITILAGAGVCFFFSCSSQTSDPEVLAQEKFQIYQVPGCVDSARNTIIDNELCFSYSFTDILTVDFCLPANCCPDTNRFEFSYIIAEDHISVAVADTTERLCRCICPYILRAEIHDLPLDRYVFVCTYDGEIWYSEEIQR